MSSDRPPHWPQDPALGDVLVGMVAHEELIEAVGKLANGTAPGPNGLSAEILKILVQDVVCRDALRRILRDIMNFRIDESVRRRITRCRLVALPKPDGERGRSQSATRC